MLPDPATTAVASSWTALFAAVWFARNRTNPPVRPPEAWRRRDLPATRATGDERRRGTRGDGDRVDLFPPVPVRTSSRWDDAVAWPIDTPRRLDATIDTIARRLRALPEPHDLGRRSLHYRAELERTLRDVRQALARLDEGTYGTCVGCASPISLRTLTEKPWTPVCAPCAATEHPR